MSNKENASENEKIIEKELRYTYNIKKKYNLLLSEIIAGLLLFAGVLWITRKFTNINFKEGFEILVTLAVACIAYTQWRAARHEISIDKYYDRLDNANNRLEKLAGIDPVAIHVFAEMDKLEYVLMKYKIGFMPANLVYRAIENFKSLCKYRENFHRCATYYIKKAAYLPETQNLIMEILKENLPEPVIQEKCSD